ncbi:MAG: YlmH/Sll1252 family protein [Defluviitaleaceae bacterium]|nr:YlmH/Sll1252 family protein [Defluviitaleaceae bacterium]
MSLFKKPDNRFLFAKAMNQVYLCVYSHKICFSDFLDPATVSLVLQESRGEVKTKVFGGYEGAERNIIAFIPDSQPEPAQIDFPISRIMISYDKKFVSDLRHGDFLGSLIGLGIDRDKIGDIVIVVGGAVVITDNAMANFVLSNLEKIGRASIKTKLLSPDDDFFGLNNQQVKSITISSLRLDSVLAAAFPISRKAAASSIEAGRAFINWQEINSPSALVNEKDIITLRKFGRIRINEIVGKSRKDKIIIEITQF